MNSDCFKVYDTDCQRAPLSSLNSPFFLFFPLSASKIVILQKTITKSLFLKKSDCWAELGSADTLIRSLECVTVTAVTSSSKWALGCLSWLCLPPPSPVTTLLSVSMGQSLHLPSSSSPIPLHSDLLSVCFIYPCLRFYFVHQFFIY